jgi:histidyl-tRNA synthetase
MAIEMARGVRDFPPEEKIIRQEVVGKLTTVFERYGFSPLETPGIERLEILSAKFAAGEASDVQKEIFQLSDQGGRKLGLRFDLTVPLARFLAMNPNLKMPFKRYEIGRTYRDGPIKLGRYREFWQCDVDIIGCKAMIAEAELMKLSLDVFRELELDAYLEINNRKLLNGILDYAGVAMDKRDQAIVIIDKLKKIGLEEVKKELAVAQIADKSIERLIEIFSIVGEYKELLKELRVKIQDSTGVEGINELEELFSYFGEEELKNIRLNISLARGLSYYTGPVFEGFLKESAITNSICGGGRYDCLIKLYMGGDKEYPATGISFGLEPITEALKLLKQNIRKTVSQLYVVPIKTVKESLALAQELRRAGLKVDVDLLGRGVSKNLDYADKLGIPFCVIIGESELGAKVANVKNMKTGVEEKVAFDKLKEYKFEQ